MTKLLLNGSSSVNYFIHGQELTLEYEFPNARFVVIKHNQIPVSDKFRTKAFWFWKRYHLLKGNKGIYKTYVNHFCPTLSIHIYESWSLLPKRYVLPLKNNRVLLQNPLPTIKEMSLRGLQNVPQGLKHQVSRIQLPTIKSLHQTYDSKCTALHRFSFESSYSKFKISHPLFLQNQELWNSQFI